METVIKPYDDKKMWDKTDKVICYEDCSTEIDGKQFVDENSTKISGHEWIRVINR